LYKWNHIWLSVSWSDPRLRLFQPWEELPNFHQFNPWHENANFCQSYIAELAAVLFSNKSFPWRFLFLSCDHLHSRISIESETIITNILRGRPLGEEW
jgi:hypothetical protein